MFSVLHVCLHITDWNPRYITYIIHTVEAERNTVGMYLRSLIEPFYSCQSFWFHTIQKMLSEMSLPLLLLLNTVITGSVVLEWLMPPSHSKVSLFESWPRSFLKCGICMFCLCQLLTKPKHTSHFTSLVALKHSDLKHGTDGQNTTFCLHDADRPHNLG